MKRERELVTWNVQEMSERKENGKKLRIMCEIVEVDGWDIVCVMGLQAEDSGMVLRGEEENRGLLVHSKRACEILRGNVLIEWTRKGQKRGFNETVGVVVFDGLKVVSAYQQCGRWMRLE